MTKMKAPVVDNPTEFSVDVSWEKVSGATGYRLYRRKIPANWDQAKVTEVSSGDTVRVTVDDLEPTSTYQFKIAPVTSTGEGEQSEEVTIDTAVGNCTPKPKKCVIQ